ncbi:MAG TPA: cytidine deaminase [Thermoanaerobaculia bacterium]|nr:cytidine deaminase [Thermoanaerobaculia bacterium]
MRRTARTALTAAGKRALVAAATRARRHAAAPYSKFRVGAALLAEDGRVFTGCNVESASYGLTVCAERTAVFKALSEGVRRFRAVAVVTAAKEPTAPCGACRQVLWDQCRDIEVVMQTTGGRCQESRLRDLLPHPFEFGGPS